MKSDRYARDLFKKLDNFYDNNRIISSQDNNIDGEDDDDYYIKTGEIPPRFQAYRHARWEKLDEWGNLTCEDVDETVTQDELDFGLKRQVKADTNTTSKGSGKLQLDWEYYQAQAEILAAEAKVVMVPILRVTRLLVHVQ